MSNHKLLSLIFLGSTLVVILVAVVASGNLLSRSKMTLQNKAAETALESTSLQTTTLQGTLESYVGDDFANKTSTTLHYFNTTINGQATSLRVVFSSGKNVKPGDYTLTGTISADNTFTVADSGIVRSQTTQDPAKLLGNNKVAIVLLHWAGGVYPSPVPANAAAAEQVFDSVENYYNTESYGRFTISNETADVYGWIESTIPRDCNLLGNFTLFGNQIDSYLSTANIYPSGVYSNVIVVFSGCSNIGWAKYDSSKVRLSSDLFMKPHVIEHELGHNYGLNHSGDFRNCPSSTNLVKYPECNDLLEYGFWEPMGYTYESGRNDNYGFNPTHKYFMGWLNDVNYKAINYNGTFNVYPLETSANNLVEVKVCRDLYSWYSIENRTGVGNNAGMPTAATAGIVIRLAGKDNAGFPKGYFQNDDLFKLVNGAIGVGQTYVDSTTGLRITLNSKNSGIANVSVQYTGTTPTQCAFPITPTNITPVPPSVTPSRTPTRVATVVTPTRTPTRAITPTNGPVATGNINIFNEAPRAYSIPRNTAQIKTYPSNNGSVRIIGANGLATVASERVIYKTAGVERSYSELLALPTNQLSRTYWFPWYNNVDLATEIRVGNMTATAATFDVYIAGVRMAGSPFSLGGLATRKLSFTGSNNGPVKIVATQNIVTTERVIYKVGGVDTSFSELMGLPDTQVDSKYYFAHYNNVDLDTQLRFANIGAATASVDVYIGGVKRNTSVITLAPNASTRVSFAGVNTGPVLITSNQPLVVAERIIYKIDGINTSFSEMMAVPQRQLTAEYWLPWYQNSGNVDSQIRFANVSASNATVKIYIAGIERGTYSLAPGVSSRISYAGLNGGPVKIVSQGGVNIIAGQRTLYKANNVLTSFSEMIALPKIGTAAYDSYALPWYDNVTFPTEFRIGTP